MVVTLLSEMSLLLPQSAERQGASWARHYRT